MNDKDLRELAESIVRDSNSCVIEGIELLLQLQESIHSIRRYMKKLMDTRNKADKIDLAKVFNELPDGSTVILPRGNFYLVGECYMKSQQVLKGQDSILISG